MSEPLRRLRGILGHKLPEEFEPDNWDSCLNIVQSATEKHKPFPGAANVMDLFKEACSIHASNLEEAIYGWNTHNVEDLLENVKKFKRAQQFI